MLTPSSQERASKNIERTLKLMPSSDVTTRKSGSDFDCWIISFMHNYCIIMLNFSVSFRHGGCFDFTLRMKSRNVSRRMFSWICPRSVRSRKFQNIVHSFRAEAANLIETHRVYYFSTDQVIIQEAFFADDSTDRNRSGHISCRPYWSVLKHRKPKQWDAT